MKTIIKLSLLVTLSFLLVTSCEKDEIIKPESESTEQLMSTTGNQELDDAADVNEIQSEVLYHESYAGDFTMEEVDELWKQKMINLEISLLKSAYSTEWFHWVRTLTGSQTNNDTDGTVHTRIYYRTSAGYSSTRVSLNNPGNDREKGQWDYYLVRSYISGKSVSWVEENSAMLYLKGTDGWYVTQFHVCLFPNHQSIKATGGSHIHSWPNVWLDSSRKRKWDSYWTGNVGTDRLNF